MSVPSTELGLPAPSSASECVFPLRPNGGKQNSLAGEGVGQLIAQYSQQNSDNFGDFLHSHCPLPYSMGSFSTPLQRVYVLAKVERVFQNRFL